jgi:hypothetical protein
MFEYGTKSDVEGGQASLVAYCRGAGVLSAVVGTLGLLSGQTLLGLSNLVFAVSIGVFTPRSRKLRITPARKGTGARDASVEHDSYLAGK